MDVNSWAALLGLATVLVLITRRQLTSANKKTAASASTVKASLFEDDSSRGDPQAETPNRESGERIVPVFVAIDESDSMVGLIESGVLGEVLTRMHLGIASDPLIDSRFRAAVCAFSEQAETLVPLTKLSYLPVPPRPKTCSGLNNGSIFELLSSEINSGITQLKTAGHQILRPLVIFITQGRGFIDDWHTARARLVDETNPYRPNIVSLGYLASAQPKSHVRDLGPDVKVLRALATSEKWGLVVSDSELATDVLKKFFEALHRELFGMRLGPPRSGDFSIEGLLRVDDPPAVS